MINISKKSECCGCWACYSACPRSCITMVMDSEGFLYPKADPQLCVHCNQCISVCPIQNPEKRKYSTQNTYAAYHTSEKVRQESSSGGVFYALAQMIFARNGIVYGAGFDEYFQVLHMSAENSEALRALQGSKYVQSHMRDVFFQVKEQLEENRWVLFTGTACQIAGLKKYLGKEYAHLLTADVLCHGVPSERVWQKYIVEKQQADGALNMFSFRDKSTGWSRYSVKAIHKEGRSTIEPMDANPYMKLFLSDICLRPSCHECKFKGMDRPSDLSIGDCWSIDRVFPDMNDDKGVSVVIVHTENGHKLLSESKMLYMREGELEQLLPPDSAARKSVHPHIRREHFFALLNRGADIETLVKCAKLSFLDKVLRLIRNNTN